MMFTINKVFIDSSILIEYIKQNKVDLLDELTKQSSLSLFINSIVISEFTFHLIALKGNKSPLTLKASSLLGRTVQIQTGKTTSVTGVVSAVQVTEGTPTIVVNGRGYDLSDLLNITPTPASTATP